MNVDFIPLPEHIEEENVIDRYETVFVYEHYHNHLAGTYTSLEHWVYDGNTWNVEYIDTTFKEIGLIWYKLNNTYTPCRLFNGSYLEHGKCTFERQDKLYIIYEYGRVMESNDPPHFHIRKYTDGLNTILSLYLSTGYDFDDVIIHIDRIIRGREVIKRWRRYVYQVKLKRVSPYYYKWLSIASRPPYGCLYLYDMNAAKQIVLSNQ